MFENFEKKEFTKNSIAINYVVGGQGLPLLLLHGYPQTHVIWHKITPALAEKYTIVAGGQANTQDMTQAIIQQIKGIKS